MGESRERSFEEVLESEARCREYFERSPNGIVVLDGKRCVLEVNRTACEITGFSREELEGRDFSLVASPETRAEGLRAFERAVETGRAETEDLELLRRDGARVPVFITGVRLDDGRHVVFFQDITRRKRDELRLRQLSRAVEQSANAILITDPAGRIEYVNPKFTQATGWSAEEAVGRNPRILSSGLTPPDVYRDLWATVTAGREWHGEMVNRTKSGALATVLSSVSPICDAGGAVTHFVGVQEDVTERRRMEEQLRFVQRIEAVGRLAGGVAHDFNNVLSVILGYGELLAQQMGSADPRAGWVREMREAAERAAHLTRQLLAFSRKQVLEPEPLDLNEVVAGVEKLVRRLIGEDVRLEFAPGAGLEKALADPSQVEQVVMNLAVNARDAMPEGGVLAVATANAEIDAAFVESHAGARAGRYVALEVRDTGTGMDRDTLAHIFEPFFTTKETGKGTGLGLATVYGIVKQSEGYVVVESEPGRGSTFRIYFPRAEGARPARPSGRSAAFAGTTGTAATILVVEDEPAVRALARRVLEEAGHRVLEAADAAAAVDAMRGAAGPVDLVLSDVIMPGESGPALVRRLRSERPRLRALFMSGYTASETVSHGLAAEEDSFLQKPFTAASLLQCVQRALRAGNP